MRTFIEKLDELVQSNLNPQAFENPVEASTALLSALHLLLHEKDMIRRYLLQAFFSIRNTNELRLLVSQYQSFFIGLLNRLHEYRIIAPSADYIQRAYTEAGNSINDLLKFIEQQCTNYIDTTQKLPDDIRIACQQEVSEKMEQVKTVLSRSVDTGLNDIVLQFLQRFSDQQETQSVSYRLHYYVQHFLNELLKLGELSKEQCVFSAMKELLIYLNFNSIPFLNFVIRQYESTLSQQHDLTAKIAYLKRHYKEMKTIHAQAETGLNPEQLSVKQVFSKWLKEELHLAESTTQEEYLLTKFRQSVIEWQGQAGDANEIIISLHEAKVIYIDGKPATISQLAHLFEEATKKKLDIFRRDYTNRQRKKGIAPFLDKLKFLYLNRDQRLSKP